MSTPINKIPFLVIGLAFIIILLIYILVQSTPQSTVSNNTPLEKNTADTISEKPNIAKQWQWKKAQKTLSTIQKKKQEDTALPFTTESVHNALQEIKLDSQGNIILDHDALLSLDEALERIHNKLDDSSLNTLQILIKEALPGKTGEQTAKIVGDYYHFLQAKEEFSQINETISENTSEELSNEQRVVSIENDQAIYAELQALREVHIGKEATNSLFRVSDANAEFMFESMKLEHESTLSNEQREIKRQEIQERYVARSVNIHNWPERYQTFLQDKQNIVTASISAEEKSNQLQNLLTQHFDNDERQRIEHLGLDHLDISQAE